MTALIDTLFQLEKQLGIELDSLLPFAEADTLGGYHPDATIRKWGSGAVWEVEGRTLFALVRALKPQTILEIGSGTGCSTNHMAKAVQQNGSGHITTIDRANTPYVAHELRDLITVRNDDAINYLALQPDNSIDFLLEDADHSIQLCQAIGELAKTKLKPGGVLIAHDARHPIVGADVRRGYDLAGMEMRTYLQDDSDCGWAVWKRPDVAKGKGLAPLIEKYDLDVIGETLTNIYSQQTDDSPVIDFAVLQAQEEPNATPEQPAHPTIPRNYDTHGRFDPSEAYDNLSPEDKKELQERIAQSGKSKRTRKKAVK